MNISLKNRIAFFFEDNKETLAYGAAIALMVGSTAFVGKGIWNIHMEELAALQNN